MNVSRRILLCLLTSLTFLGSTTSTLAQDETNNSITNGAAKKTIVFAAPDLIDKELLTAGENFYREVFRRLGYEFKMEILPSERAIQATNQGRYDGEVGRIKRNIDLLRQFPNLIQAEEPLLSLDLAAYMKAPNIHIGDWEDLSSTDYRIGYRRGNKVVELNKILKQSRNVLIDLNSTAQAMHMLDLGRLQIVIEQARLAQILLNSAPLKESGITQVAILERQVLYPYLHIRNTSINHPLSEAIRQAKLDGSFEKYFGFKP